MNKTFSFFVCLFAFLSCNAKKDIPPVINPVQLIIKQVTINDQPFDATVYNISTQPTLAIIFNTKLDKNTINESITITDKSGVKAEYTAVLSNQDSVLVITPLSSLKYFNQYRVVLGTQIKSVTSGALASSFDQTFYTKIDSSRKFPSLTENQLLDKVQQQTLKYFWEFGHPISGLSRERTTTPETVTIGGTGFGIMSIVVGASRNFITRDQAITRLATMASFLKNTAQTFHGAFPHWMNGSTGKAIAFSPKDDGADLVETAYLAEGLICAREYFNGNNISEQSLRNDINIILDRIEWSWFRRNNQNTLYWHWSPNYDWQMNMPIKGWNECLIAYVMAGSSKNYAIPKEVYANGWTAGNEFLNGKNYYGYNLPLGPAGGGPLFFEHYSFLGINPMGLSDAHANYETQVKNHTLINYSYCLTQKNFPYAYSDSIWGLTASDIPNGYDACSPTNDRGVIAPTAAIASMPYAPEKSMAALSFYYYTLGDKLFKEYGFVDAFSIKDSWVADSFLAIDQGPIIVMIENYRSGLIWNLFMQAPEVQSSLKMLGFSSPNIH